MIPIRTTTPLCVIACGKHAFKTAARGNFWPPRLIPEMWAEKCPLIPVDHSKERNATWLQHTVRLTYLHKAYQAWKMHPTDTPENGTDGKAQAEHTLTRRHHSPTSLRLHHRSGLWDIQKYTCRSCPAAATACADHCQHTPRERLRMHTSYPRTEQGMSSDGSWQLCCRKTRFQDARNAREQRLSRTASDRHPSQVAEVEWSMRHQDRGNHDYKMQVRAGQHLELLPQS